MKAKYHSYENEFYLHANRKSFSYQWLRTWRHFETETRTRAIDLQQTISVQYDWPEEGLWNKFNETQVKQNASMKLGNLSTCTARRLVHCHCFSVIAPPWPSSPI